MNKFIVEVEGMACGVCEAHINKAVFVSKKPYEKKGLFSVFRG